jgi:tRNA dimethylallyltransferase
MANKQLFVVAGPTASGKTAFAIEQALGWGGVPIVSADSRQIYREMRIGTAVPTDAELGSVHHNLIQHVSIHEPYSVGDYERDALACIEQGLQNADRVILCGGTGLYIKAVMSGLDVFPEVPFAVRSQVNSLWETSGITGLQAQLVLLDPDYFEQVDQLNPARLRRALEVCLSTGRPFSSFRQGASTLRPFEITGVVIQPPRDVLRQRIEQRVDMMMAEGLLEEAQSLYPFRHLQALQTVGYRELFDYVEGHSTLGAAVDLIKVHTWQFARRQMTWFNKAVPDWPRVFDHLGA